jgi:hypothetical protein
MRNPRSTVSMFMMFGGTIGSTVSTVALYFVRNHQIVANDFNFVITNKSTIYPNENFNFECSLFQGDKPLSSISNDARYNFSLYDE